MSDILYQYQGAVLASEDAASALRDEGFKITAETLNNLRTSFDREGHVNLYGTVETTNRFAHSWIRRLTEHEAQVYLNNLATIENWVNSLGPDVIKRRFLAAIQILHAPEDPSREWEVDTIEYVHQSLTTGMPTLEEP